MFPRLTKITLDALKNHPSRTIPPSFGTIRLKSSGNNILH